MPTVALIHALPHAIAPINTEMERAWPECRRVNLLDDSLPGDLARSPDGLDARFFDRLHALAEYALSVGADGLLFSCSAFGPCIEAVAARHPGVPVLKPNEAMIAEAAAHGGRIGLIGTFAPTLESMPAEFPSGCDVRVLLADGALDALNAGDGDRHDALIADGARRLAAEGCAVIALAQFSMARASEQVSRACGVPVLTTVASAVQAMRVRLGH
jgi:aspartate/glutamate racemase